MVEDRIKPVSSFESYNTAQKIWSRTTPENSVSVHQNNYRDSLRTDGSVDKITLVQKMLRISFVFIIYLGFFYDASSESEKFSPYPSRIHASKYGHPVKGHLKKKMFSVNNRMLPSIFLILFQFT